ncbi:hypothetical protein ACIF80_30715 [Streptomyces sp. NPDC085927]|uniref:hypothetical protein n=1 Tax=Streptomyces sp. NPDC085927 TaxID=3365738 RepID=UPI0037CF864E
MQISTDCWKASRDADTKSKEEWLAARRAKEQQAASEWAERFDMPPLEGPEKARTIIRAGWWIDQRDTDGADLLELLEAATDDDCGTENPFR